MFDVTIVGVEEKKRDCLCSVCKQGLLSLMVGVGLWLCQGATIVVLIVYWSAFLVSLSKFLWTLWNAVVEYCALCGQITVDKIQLRDSDCIAWLNGCPFIFKRRTHNLGWRYDPLTCRWYFNVYLERFSQEE